MSARYDIHTPLSSFLQSFFKKDVKIISTPFEWAQKSPTRLVGRNGLE